MDASNVSEKESKIAKNYVYSLLYQIFTIITPLITTPYISRVLGATNIGIYGYVESICLYFIVMGNLGFPLLGQREIAYTSDNIELRSKKFADIMIGKTFFLSISFIAYLIFALLIIKDNKIIFLSYSLGIVADLLNVGWFFQGLEDFKTTVTRNFIIKILSVSSIFIFVRSENDLLKYSLLINIANIIGNLFVVFALRKKVHYSEYKFSIKRVTCLIKPAFVLAIPYYIASIYTVVDKTMIGMICDNYAEVGFYEQSQKIITFSLAIITALGTVFMPRLAKEAEKNDTESVKYFLHKGIDVIMMISFPLFAGLICIGDMVVPWFFGDGFEKVGILIMTFSPLALFLGMNAFLGNQYLVSSKKERLLTITILIGVVTNISLNCVLIPSWNSIGAAVATVISECVKLAFLVIVLRKIISVRFMIKRALRYFLTSIPMLLVGITLKNVVFQTYSMLNTLILIGMCIVVYLVTLIVTKNETVFAVIQTIKSKKKKNNGRV